MSLKQSISDEPPYPPADLERAEIWRMLVVRDTDAYLNQDWAAVAGDFVAESFYGIDAGRHPDPDRWRIAFPTLDAYRVEWLRQAALTAASVDKQAARAAFRGAVTLDPIEISDDFAIAHKKFDGRLPNLDGSHEELHWQTLYVCRKHGGRWKIASFVGYMHYDTNAGAQP